MDVKALESLVRKTQDRRITFRDALSSSEKTELELEIVDLLCRLRKKRIRAIAHRLPPELITALKKKSTPDWPLDHHLNDLITAQFWPAALAATNEKPWIRFNVNAVNELHKCGLSAVGIAQLEEDCNLHRYLKFRDLMPKNFSERTRRSDARVRKIRSAALRFQKDITAAGEPELFEEFELEMQFSKLYDFLNSLVAEADARILKGREYKSTKRIASYNTKGKSAILVIAELCRSQGIRISATQRSRFKRVVEVCFETMSFPGNAEYEIDRLIAHRRAVGTSSITGQKTIGGRGTAR